MTAPVVAILAFVGMFVAYAVLPSFLKKRASRNVEKES